MDETFLSSPCVQYDGYKDKDGYGRLYLGGKRYGTHRLIWELLMGPIPDDLHVCHHCDNPSCINLEHIFLGSPKDNALDRESKSRGNHSFGERNGSSKLKEGEVLWIMNMKGILSYKRLSEIFNVSKSVIFSIWRNDTWKHLS